MYPKLSKFPHREIWKGEAESKSLTTKVLDTKITLHKSKKNSRIQKDEMVTLIWIQLLWKKYRTLVESEHPYRNVPHLK